MFRGIGANVASTGYYLTSGTKGCSATDESMVFGRSPLGPLWGIVIGGIEIILSLEADRTGPTAPSI
jgi:hypothetical protein